VQPLSEKDELSTAQLSIECQHSPKIIRLVIILTTSSCSHEYHLKTPVQKVDEFLGHFLLATDLRLAIRRDEPDGSDGVGAHVGRHPILHLQGHDAQRPNVHLCIHSSVVCICIYNLLQSHDAQRPNIHLGVVCLLVHNLVSRKENDILE